MNNENTGDTPVMHNIGDHVMYRQNGICKITDIRNENFAGMGARTYYILVSEYNKDAKTYVPVDSEELTSQMRHVLSEKEINDIITSSDDEKRNSWIDDDKLRAERFEEILACGDRAQILWLVKVLSIHKEEVEQKKKKFYVRDEKILTAAEKAITEEFAYVLGIDKQDVIPYILKKLKKTSL